MPGCLSKKRQPIIKLSDKNDNPGDLPGWKEALSIPLLCTHIAPKEQVELSPYEMLCERPFVYVNDLFLDPEAQTPPVLYNGHWAIPIRYVLVRCQLDPKDSKEPPLYVPGTEVLIRVRKDGSSRDQPQPT